jgi:multiple sugar transport system substrate-binding protein
MAAAKADTYDVFTVDDTISTTLDAIGATVPLTELWKKAPGDFKPEDYPLRTWAAQAMVKGKWVAVPNMGALGILAYRKDLFNDPAEQAAYKAKYGVELKPPETWDEYLQVGQFFTRPDKGLYGFNHRYGSPNNIMFDWIIGFFYSRGGTLFDDKFNPTINSQEGKDAANFFLAPAFLACQPPGKEAFQFENVMQNMVQGKVAMYLTESWSVSLLMDTANPYGGPDKIGITSIPGWKDPATGKIMRSSLLAGTGWSINANISDKKKAIAWDYIMYTMSSTMLKQFAAEQGYAPLISVFKDPELAKKYPWLPMYYEMSKVAKPRTIEAFELELENSLGTELQAALAGKQTPEQALAKASDEWVKIVHTAGYDDGKHTFQTAEKLEAMACQFYKDIGRKHPDCP